MKMNKYQVALDNAKDDIEYCYNDSFEEVPEKRLKEVELLQELVGKETPMKVDINTEGVYYRTKYDEDINRIVVSELNYDCPRCGLNVVIDNEYCPHCGQHLNWSNEN